MAERLFVGGPAHGRWIAVPDGEHMLRVPVPVRPTLWQEGDGLYPPVDEHRYYIETVAMFGHVIRVMIDSALIPAERAWQLIDVLLSSDAKALIS